MASDKTNSPRLVTGAVKCLLTQTISGLSVRIAEGFPTSEGGHTHENTGIDLLVELLHGRIPHRDKNEIRVIAPETSDGSD